MHLISQVARLQTSGSFLERPSAAFSGNGTSRKCSHKQCFSSRHFLARCSRVPETLMVDLAPAQEGPQGARQRVTLATGALQPTLEV